MCSNFHSLNSLFLDLIKKQKKSSVKNSKYAQFHVCAQTKTRANYPIIDESDEIRYS